MHRLSLERVEHAVGVIDPVFRDQLVGTIICGSNLTVEQMARWL